MTTLYSQIAEEKGDVDGALFFLNKLLVLQDTNLVLMIKIGDLLNKKNTFEDSKRSTNHIPSAGGEKKGGVSQVGVVGCSMAC